MPRPHLVSPSRARAAALLCVLALAAVGRAQGDLPAKAQPPGVARPGPRPPQPQPTLSLAQTRALLTRAAAVVAALEIGEVRRTPAGIEASLTYRGQVVSAVGLDLQGNVQPLATPRPPGPGDGPLVRRGGPWAAPTPPAVGTPLPAPRPVSPTPVTLSAQARARLGTQVRRLYVSGAVRVAGPQVRVTLLGGGVAVAELRFGEGGALKSLPDPTRDGPDAH